MYVSINVRFSSVLNFVSLILYMTVFYYCVGVN